MRERDTAVERCEVSIQDRPDKTECRLIVKMVCRHGIYLFSFTIEMCADHGVYCKGLPKRTDSHMNRLKSCMHSLTKTQQRIDGVFLPMCFEHSSNTLEPELNSLTYILRLEKPHLQATPRRSWTAEVCRPFQPYSILD